MKKNYKKISCCLFMLFTASFVFAQEASEDIELPEVTTVIEGESIKAGLDTIPDFHDVIIDIDGSGTIVPVLPDVEISENEKVDAEAGQAEEKSIYAEGQLGGGYPSLFKGDFSVYRLNGESPFSLSFHHNSSAGYTGKALASGYNNRDTSMSVEKTITKNKLDFTFGGFYETKGIGLQNKCVNISNYDDDTVTAFSDFKWKLPKDIQLGVRLDGGFYDRYADITSIESFTGPSRVKNSAAFDFIPAIYFDWQKNGFKLGFDGNYWFGTYKPVSEDLFNRGDFGIELSWQNDAVLIFGDVDVVFGSVLEGESVVAPFAVGIEADIPVHFSSRKVGLELEGGLNSSRNSISEIEKKYSFTSFSFMPSETSEWYGKFNLSLPLKTAFTGTLGLGFNKTAFDNGRFMANYSDSTLSYGMYDYERKDVTMFSTNFDLAYHHNIFSLMAGWHSNWIDVPVLESAQQVVLNCSIQSEESKWGINLSGKFNFGDNMPVPFIDLDGYVRVTPAVRIVLGAEDILKLIAGESRSYAGQYSAQGGNVCLLVKFFF